MTREKERTSSWQRIHSIHPEMSQTAHASTTLCTTIPDHLALGGLLSKATFDDLKQIPSHWISVGRPLSPCNLPALQAKNIIFAQTSLPSSLAGKTVLDRDGVFLL